MQFYGHEIFFACFVTVFMTLTIFGLYSNQTGTNIKVKDQGEFQAVSTRAAPTAAQLSDIESQPSKK